MTPRVSIVVPAKAEGPAILPVLDRLLPLLPAEAEVLVVCDTADDPTFAAIRPVAGRDPRVRETLNTYGAGPANAIRFGFDRAQGDVVVVTMADGSDEVERVPEMIRLVEDGAAVVSASRYARGGRQIGGPIAKRVLSRAAGLSLAWLARVGTSDATNSFKAYSRLFVEEAGVESSAGFEVGIELVAKARRLRRRVAEVPTVWRDRVEGRSNFKVLRWIPRYLRWYRFAFGRRLEPGELRARRAGA